MQNETEGGRQIRLRQHRPHLRTSISRDPILTGSCQRYDRVITALTPPSAAGGEKKPMMHSLVKLLLCYQRNRGLPPPPPPPNSPKI